MSLVHSSIHQLVDHLSPTNKRKLDDYGPIDEDDDLSEIAASSIRMRKVESLCSTLSPLNPHKPPAAAATFINYVHDSETLARGESSSRLSVSESKLQFFVRLISSGNTLVIRANQNDTVEMVLEKIRRITRIPVDEQRLIYRGRQLEREMTLAHYSIQNDAGLQLVGIMRSTVHPRAWRVINEMVSIICRICKESSSASNAAIKAKLHDYITRVPKEREGCDGYSVKVIEYFKVFMDSCAAKALVMLYMSPDRCNKDCGEDFIRCFINSVLLLDIPEKEYVATIVLEFCKLLREVGDDDPLYLHCRSALGCMVATVGDEDRWKTFVGYYVRFVEMEDILPYFVEVARGLSKNLAISMESSATLGHLARDGHLVRDVGDFTAFLRPLYCSVSRFGGLVKVPVDKAMTEAVISLGAAAKFIFEAYAILFDQVDECLRVVEQKLRVKGEGQGGTTYQCAWSQYLAILKELHSISVLYHGAELKFWTMMSCRKDAVRALIVKCAKRTEDHQWLFDHKDVTDFESRRHLAMLMFPDFKEDFDELHEMLIDRSQLLAESFEYISRAEPPSLHAGLFMEFKNEEATGPGVLREWFFLVCQAIFDPQNALFVACPHDRRRFFPNPASKVDPMHLKYFRFSGRVVALTLMHKIQVGIVLDRVFFLQLAGRGISLEDIKDADPYMYNSCKQILEMDAEFIDSDALGLTFVREVEELGSRKVVELCPGGKSMIVNSINRVDYINLLIQHRFVNSTKEQVSEFGQGFADILYKKSAKTPFFESLELQDLDWMLHGSGGTISVDDWEEHTEYNGYKKTDKQILWFWEVVREMVAEQRKVLLFFWTSVKYLPVEGFRGLTSRLYIYNSFGTHDRLPSSHTCFYRLSIPPYSSKAVMEERLRIITQEHVGCSFGTW